MVEGRPTSPTISPTDEELTTLTRSTVRARPHGQARRPRAAVRAEEATAHDRATAANSGTLCKCGSDKHENTSKVSDQLRLRCRLNIAGEYSDRVRHCNAPRTPFGVPFDTDFRDSDLSFRDRACMMFA